MKTLLKVTAVLILLILLTLPALWLTLPRWLPQVVKPYLPDGTVLSLSQPDFQWRGVFIPQWSLNAENTSCVLAAGTNLKLHFDRDHRWVAAAGTLSGDPACWQQLPEAENSPPSGPLDIKALLAPLPPITLIADDVALTPWEAYRGALTITTSPADGQHLHYEGDNVQADIRIDSDLNVTLSQLNVTVGEDHFALTGETVLPLTTAQLPDNGRIQADVVSTLWPQPVALTFSWQQQSGRITLRDADFTTPLLDLPWQATRDMLTITDGTWRWDRLKQPLRGTANATLRDWQKSLSDMRLAGRVSVTTEGQRGKGTVVLQIPETVLPLTGFDMPFQLAGQVNVNDMWAAGRVPAVLTGTTDDPVIRITSGALVRAKGRLSPTMRVEELRLPLAGTQLSLHGISGPLDAIVTVNNPELGRYKFQMKGQAREFLPDEGHWYWQIWGSGNVKPVHADWTFSGAGSWIDEEIRIRRLDTGFKGIRYGMMSMDAPSLTLLSPLVWQRKEKNPVLSGKLQLTTRKIRLGDSFLPSATFTSELTGRDPQDFSVKGSLSAGKLIGPIEYWSRWDGVRLRGEARWPSQELRAFQTLIPKGLGMTVRDGQFYAQAAYSAAPGQGFVAGGHWVVKNGSLWLKDGEVNGVDFILPWRLADSRWQLGSKTPVTLRIGRISNLFDVTDIRADLQGYYPYDEQYPLRLTGVSLDLLGGQVTLPELRIPQNTPAVIRLNHLSMGPLINTLKVTQFALDGSVSGELPFYIDNPQWIVHDGWVENDGPLTLNLDKQFVTSVSDSNVSAGAAINWLDYLVMKRVRTDINLTNLGVLTMKSAISGHNPVRDARRAVNLNYNHEENIFQLWRSLRFGSNLEEWLEKSISQQESH